MKEPWGHYAKRNKPATNTQKNKCCMPPSIWGISKVVKLIEMESRIVVTRNWGGRSCCQRGTESSLPDEKVLKICLTRIWICVTLLNCTLKNEYDGKFYGTFNHNERETKARAFKKMFWEMVAILKKHIVSNVKKLHYFIIYFVFLNRKKKVVRHNFIFTIKASFYQDLLLYLGIVTFKISSR